EAHQRVTGSDVEVDVGQWFQVFYPVDLCHQLEEEPQLTNFHGLFHDVYTIEVIDNYRFEDEVATVRVLINLLQDAAKIGKPPRMVPLARALQVVHERLHAVQARLIEWLQDIECSKQKRPGATGRVEDRDGRDSLIERPQQFWSFAIADDVLGE